MIQHLFDRNFYEGEGEVVFSMKSWDCRSRKDLMRSNDKALPGFETCLPDCSGCKVRGLHIEDLTLAKISLFPKQNGNKSSQRLKSFMLRSSKIGIEED